MTNYEWLVKSEQLNQFIYDFLSYDLTDRKNTDRIYDRYGLELCWGDSISRKIGEWLISQRKTTKKYVEVKKVADIIFLIPLRRPVDQKKFSKGEVQQLFSDYRIDLLSAIKKFKTKEIDE